MKRLFTRLGIALTLVALVLAGFAAPNNSAQATDPDTFYGGWPYSVPPKGHLNTFVPDGLALGIYQDLLEPSLAMFVWAQDSYRGLLAESWGFEGDDTYVVQLKSGAMWSDGSPVTARDVVVTYAIGRLRNFADYTYVDTVSQRDDLTVEFKLKNPSTLVERLLLRTRIRAAGTYGAIAEKVEAFLAAGKDRADADKAEWDAIVAEINDYRPEKLLSSGPYTLDLADVTDAQLTLRRNEFSIFKEAKFDKVVLYNGETEAVTPLFLAKEIYYGTYFFPQPSERAMLDAGFTILRSPTYSGPGLFFNYEKVPAFQDVRVRQAIAYAINRAEVGAVSYGDLSGNPAKYMVGISDSAVPNWLPQDVIASLNTYDYNLEMANQLMQEAGYTKEGDVWTKDGAAFEVELLVPSDFTDWVPAGENAAEQLTAFGIRTTVRGTPRTQQVADVRAGAFDMSILLWGFPNPHPFYAYRNMYITNTVGKTPDEKGAAIPLVQTVDGEEYDFSALITASGQGIDFAPQREAVTKLAVSFNKLLPIVPLVERLGNTPLLTEALEGVPSLDDPLYINAFGQDSYIVLWIMDGTLGPKQ
jgi:peptide/nickel transport system substrate-binding protein